MTRLTSQEQIAAGVRFKDPVRERNNELDTCGPCNPLLYTKAQHNQPSSLKEQPVEVLKDSDNPKDLWAEETL